MAEYLGKDSATYVKERDSFIRDLRHFHDTRGTAFKRCPTLGGQEIDLYLLYSLVTAEGGWVRVNSRNSWDEFFHYFKLPPSCVNGSVALKQIYLRYLDRWEKVHFLGEDADRASDDDEESRHKRWSARALHSVPHTYNYNQHNVPDEKRDYHHMATNVYKQSDYDRLALSLISPLPNEQDFAINVCTLLSNDSRHTLKLDKHPRIVNYLLAHAGIFNHGSLRQLFTHYYGNIRKKPIHNFWNDVLESEEFLDLVNETKFYPSPEAVTPGEPASSPCDTLIQDDYLRYAGLVTRDEESGGGGGGVDKRNDKGEGGDAECQIVDDSVSNPKYFRFKSYPPDKELFCLQRTLGTQDQLGQRVLQIATILRNLCFIEENVPVLSKNSAFVRFLLLCACSQWNILKNLGFDMLGNLAMEFELRDGATSDLLGVTMLKVVSKNLQSDDRASCLCSVEVLNKLSQNERNEDMLLRSLESSVYRKVCSFLTIHDVMLLIYTLECLYSLSSLGERSCNFIASNHGVIDTLVSLITVEGKSYGPKACIGMKLVETIPSGSQQTGAQSQQQAATSQQQQTSTAVTISSSSIVASTVNSITSLTASPPPPSVTPVKVIPSTPVRVVPMQPQRLLATPLSAVKTVVTQTPVKTTATASLTVTTTTPTVSMPPVAPSLTPQQLIQQQHAHQQAIQENEQFALAWLRATYEPCASGTKIDHQELYKHYISSCTKIGRRGVISPLHFPRCVRSVFGGTVGPNPMKPANPNDPQYYEGIKVRAQPLKLNIPTPPPPVPSPAPPLAATVVTKPVARRKQKVTPLAVDASAEGGALHVLSPASPILKAQLSAPPKQREGGAADAKSQAITHPHLSHALLGTTTSTTTTTAAPPTRAEQDAVQNNSSSSLIKSLLANKVNDACLPPVSMKTAATDCQNVAQVAARQQKLLAQQGTSSSEPAAPKNQSRLEALKMHRINGVRQLFTDGEVGDPSVSSTTQFVNTAKGKKEPPQPPPPPLAPLSNNVKPSKTPPVLNEDSDSLGNHSTLSSASGVGAVGLVSSTEDNENSLTSFEGLLNGIPIVEESLSNSNKEPAKHEITMDKPLRLADLLEKKFDKTAPVMLNGSLSGKDLIKPPSDKSDLLENHIEKALSRDMDSINHEPPPPPPPPPLEPPHGVKRHASEDLSDSANVKKPHLAANVNGSAQAPDSSSCSNEGDRSSSVSTAAAKLFADMAADILEDEDMLEESAPPASQPAAPAQPTVEPGIVQQQQQQQLIVDNNQQVLMSQPRQIIVSQGQVHPANQSVVISSGTQLKTQSGQTVIVQNAGVQQRQSVLIQSGNPGQLLLSQSIQNQVQLVSGGQPGQYLIQTNTGQGYVVAQPQATMVHGQPQTVLVAQQGGQSSGTKTIIILQQQPSGSATHHQKVMVTPQGQQVVVTQVPRPVAQSSSVSNNIQQTRSGRPTPSPSPALSTTSTSSTISNGVKDKTEEPAPRPRLIRDITTAFVCEWGDCVVETKFKSPNQVYMHACEAHCPQGDEEVLCQWDRCDNLKRKRFSLMTHLHDKHCNIDAMKQSLVRRKKMSQGINVEPPPPTTTTHPGYAPDAALHAIKRHALEFVNPKELQIKTPKGAAATIKVPPPPSDQDDNEGPVTKSIRLTASLILRNLVIYSSNCKRYLKSYESHLANVALSNVESSRTIAQILYDINDGSTHR